MNKTMPSRSKNVTFCIKEKIVDLNWYMFSPQIAGWRQNCSVWTSYIIISICCLNEGSYMIYLNVYNQFYVLEFCIHKKETRQKSAWRRGWRADRRKIWRRSRKFSSFIWLKVLHRWVPFCSINTYLGPSVGGRILRWLHAGGGEDQQPGCTMKHFHGWTFRQKP